MNLILLFEEDFITTERVLLKDRRCDHILKVHRAEPGDTLSVGLLNGMMGTGRLISSKSDRVELEVNLYREPPSPLPLTLIIALPRPKMLRRIFQSVASLGIKELYIINSWRVEKSFWSTPFISEDAVKKELILGLEQAKDTLMPNVYFKRLFKPFVTNELPLLLTKHIPDRPDCKPGSLTAITAHPGGAVKCPEHIDGEAILVMGPEGGFIEMEISTLENAGLTTVTLGDRILRLETAIPYIVSRLF